MPADSMPEPAASASVPVFELQNVWKRYGGKQPLRGADLRVERGECVVVLGRSGAGKSVAMRLLLGFDSPDSGKARVFGDLPPFSPYRRAPGEAGRVGVLFQNDALLEDRSVLDNVALAAALQPGDGGPGGEAHAAALLRRVGLSPGDDGPLKPSHLSGGMRKRAALARALASAPEALLIDEPTAGLDAATGRRIVDLLRETIRSSGLTALVITHDAYCARRLADRLFCFSPEGGRLEPKDAAALDEEKLIEWLAEPARPAALAEPAGSGEQGWLAGRAGRAMESLGAMALEALRAAAPPDSGEFLRRLREIGLGSLPLAALVFTLTGMIMYIQARSGLGPIGMASKLPEVLAEAGMTMMPALAGLILAGRTGSTICAEMCVLGRTEQLSAMRALGLRPERRLLSPWLYATAAAFPLLTVFAAGAAMAGAAALLASPGAGVGMADPTPSKFFLEALGRLEAGKVVAGLVKSVLFGMAVALSAYFSGSRERLDPGSTGRAITRALVASFIAIVALDLLVSALGWNG